MGRQGPGEKPFTISKWLVKEAYERVKRNKGAAGVDGCTIEDFEKDLDGNLYKIWNRMSSGTYFPPPVRAVEIGSSKLSGVEVSAVAAGGGRAGAEALVFGVPEAVGVAGDGFDDAVGAF